jgi:hypothetical protein
MTFAIALHAGCASPQVVTASPVPQHPYARPASEVKPVPVGLSMARIERYLTGKGSNLQAPRPGVWHLSIEGVIVLTIVERERIRILAPIFSLEQLDGEVGVQHALMRRLLQANFEQSADARYAIFDGIVFAAVTQARNALLESDLDRFFDQVINLHKNTFRTGRTGYSSEAPDPDSIEIDPRKDESLEVPEGYDRALPPGPKPVKGRDALEI